MNQIPKKTVKFEVNVQEKNYTETVAPKILKKIRKACHIKDAILKSQKFEEIRKGIQNAFNENLEVRNKLFAKSYCAEAIFSKKGKIKEELLKKAKFHDETKARCHFFEI